MMPDMDGYTVCEKLRADTRTSEIPVIFIGALHEPLDMVKAFDVGGIDYITQPFNEAEVLARVTAHLTIHGMRRQLQTQNQRLESEVTERKYAEEALQLYNHQLAVLNEFSTLLQMCGTEQDTYDVFASICAQLFPFDSGVIAMFDDDLTSAKEVAAWGMVSPSPFFTEKAPETLRQILSDEGLLKLCREECAYWGKCPQNMYGCLGFPIVTDEGTTGMVSILISPPESGYSGQAWQQILEQRRQIAYRMIEYYALALTNLRLRERLRLESIHDVLTGLYNRRYMEDSLNREINRAIRQKISTAILVLDIDNFKSFNDTYGHEAGDMVLQALGALLQRNIRGGDIACRYGGEEFLLILPDASLESATQRANELLKQVRRLRFTYQDTSIQITASIGVSALPDHAQKFETLIRAADVALHRAKENGRNQVMIAAKQEASEGT
jgi:diguanylate cyclase (GGDEF)-like protein